MICCDNPIETENKFIEWWKGKYLPEINVGIAKINMARLVKGEAPIPKRTGFYHMRSEYVIGDNLIVNYHDGNENYIFSNKVIDLDFGDVVFVIKGDCGSYDNQDSRPDEKFWIKSLLQEKLGDL